MEKTGLSEKQNKNIFKIAGETNLRPATTGIYYKGGKITATDGVSLVIITTPYNESLEGKIMGKDGEEIEAKYPGAEKIYEKRKQSATPLNISAKDVFIASKKIRNIIKGSLKKYYSTHLIIEGQMFEAKRLYNILNLLESEEREKLILKIDSYKDLIMQKSNFDALLIMRNLSGLTIEELNRAVAKEMGIKIAFTIEEAINCENK